MKKFENIFRNLLLIVAFVTLSTTFTACSDDDEDNGISKETIIGVWKSQTSDFTEAFSEIIQFNSDGTWEGWDEESDYPDKIAVKGNWDLSGSNLNVTATEFTDDEEENLTVTFHITGYTDNRITGNIDAIFDMKDLHFTLVRFNP